ncbi:MAG: ABC transporter permease [Magnetococcales bacterium]|nr:ABC transporter permease [Magnetococcales bacterium]
MQNEATLVTPQSPYRLRMPSVRFTLAQWAPFLNLLGLGWIIPLLRLLNKQDPRTQFRELWLGLLIPLMAIGLFLGSWSLLAPEIKTSLGEIPGPGMVGEQFINLYQEHQAEQERRRAFEYRQDKLAQERAAQGLTARRHPYTGSITYLDQIVTSLQTVFAGFFIGALVAIPLGVLCGLSPTIQAAMNPLIQLFKPVSPLAWLPLVTMVVSAVYVTDNPMFEKSFLTSAVTVTLCSLWPTLINTAVGVASIDRDLMNVVRVLRLSWQTKVRCLVIPSALPYMFTGLRLSLGVGWMVLIAAEMLAQNPGLGKFVWDEFQNGSSQSLAKIMAAVLTIGAIGFLLDRVMQALQTLFSHSHGR